MANKNSNSVINDAPSEAPGRSCLALLSRPFTNRSKTFHGQVWTQERLYSRVCVKNISLFYISSKAYNKVDR